MNEITSLRQLLDETDTKLLQLLAQRQQTVHKLALLKGKQKLAVLQQAHWNDMYEKRKIQSKHYGLSEEWLKKVFHVLHELSIHYQQQLIESNKCTE